MSEVLEQVVDRDPVPPSLRAKWDAFGMVPLWESANGAFASGPTESSRQWRWSEMFPIMSETVRVASPQIVERRVMQLVGEARPARRHRFDDRPDERDLADDRRAASPRDRTAIPWARCALS